MQNRYFGDVGDYGKYSLLRRLTGVSQNTQDKSLGVVWYLFPDEGHNDDGKHISYLDKPEFRSCDPVLFDFLKSSVSSQPRILSNIESGRLLGPKTLFFKKVLDYSHIKGSGAIRRQLIAQYREEWLDQALNACREVDLIFLDPDNGLEVKSVSRTAKKAPKYVYWDEAKAFFETGASLIIYHHLNRTMTSHEQIKIMTHKISDQLSPSSIIPVLFKRGSHRVFFVVGHQGDSELLDQRTRHFVSSTWKDHAEIHYA